VEQIAPTPEDAARSVEALSTLLGMFRSIQRVQQGAPADAAMAQAIDSLKIERRDDRAVLTANIPIDLLKQLTTPARSADDTNGLR
jgi:hypothetical protein